MRLLAHPVFLLQVDTLKSHVGKVYQSHSVYVHLWFELH